MVGGKARSGGAPVFLDLQATCYKNELRWEGRWRYRFRYARTSCLNATKSLTRSRSSSAIGNGLQVSLVDVPEVLEMPGSLECHSV